MGGYRVLLPDGFLDGFFDILKLVSVGVLLMLGPRRHEEPLQVLVDAGVGLPQAHDAPLGGASLVSKAKKEKKPENMVQT